MKTTDDAIEKSQQWVGRAFGSCIAQIPGISARPVAAPDWAERASLSPFAASRPDRNAESVEIRATQVLLRAGVRVAIYDRNGGCPSPPLAPTSRCSRIGVCIRG